MKLYELKFEIKGTEKIKIIDSFGLDFFRQYSDTDYYLQSSGDKKEKYKEVDGRMVLYKINYNKDSAFFEIEDEELTEDYNRIDEVKHRKVTDKIKRIKDVYIWPGTSVRVAFDYIDGIENRIFCEFYDNDEAKVFNAKQKLIVLGFRKFINKTYDDYLSNNVSYLNIAIICLIAVIILSVIGYLILK